MWNIANIAVRKRFCKLNGVWEDDLEGLYSGCVFLHPLLVSIFFIGFSLLVEFEIKLALLSFVRPPSVCPFLSLPAQNSPDLKGEGCMTEKVKLSP
jgi:hypothetical protein